MPANDMPSNHAIWRKDLAKGTYRILTPGTYQLQEDIEFAPNPDQNFFPDPDDPTYLGPAYVLGFFAAIAIECDDVCLDLNGYELRYSKEFALQQRYGSLIELSSTPFPPGMGPADFGPSLVSASRCTIKNGTLGLVSHHSIHGNLCDQIRIEGVVCRDFEVAAISLNGSTNVSISSCTIGPNRQDIPVLGAYSHARFLLHLSQAYLKKWVDRLTDEQFERISRSSEVLEATLDRVKSEIECSGSTSDELFANHSGLLDSNCYGICIFPRGIAVHDLTDKSYAQSPCQGIRIKDVSIRDLKCNPTEIVSISEPNGDFVQFDLAGGVFQVLRCVRPDGRYVGNPLSDLQIALAAPGFKFGNMTISPDIVQWATDPAMTLGGVLAKAQYRYRCSGDVMFHLVKGSIGLRIDGTSDFSVKRVKVQLITNCGRLGNDTHNGHYQVSHTYQNRPLYHGCDSYGICLSRVSDGRLQDVAVRDVHSDNGEACGVYLNSKCRKLRLERTAIRKISSGYRRKNGKWHGKCWDGSVKPYSGLPPNVIPTSVGIHLSSNSPSLKEVTIHKLRGPRLQRTAD